MLRFLLVLGVFCLSTAVPADTMTEEFTVHTIGTVQKTGHRTTLDIRPAYRNATLVLL